MKIINKIVGVLGYMGTFKKHQEILNQMGIECILVKSKEELDSCDALIIPGTEISALKIPLDPLLPEIKQRIEDSMPLMITGESCVLLSEKELTPISWPKLIIERFSIESNKEYLEKLKLNFLDTKDFEAVFLRSPQIKKINKNFKIMAEKRENGEIVMIENKNIIACTFYPELSHDLRIHEYFVTKI